jgi:phage/plasmid-like protein (TIGR03299 family)
MPANVNSMFSVRERPWHGEGIILGDYPGSWAEARVQAGLEWEPEEADVYRVTGTKKITVPTYEFWGVAEDGQPLFRQTNVEVNDDEDGDRENVYAVNPDYKHIVRSDTKEVLSVNSKGYTLIKHEEMGEIVEAVLGQDNVKWETAGSLNNGRQVWCLAMLDEPIELPGDDSATYPYLAITNSHDGTGSCALRATAVRIVCWNTFRAAEIEGERTGATFAFRHSMKWRDRIEDARNAVKGVRKEMDAYRLLMTELLGMPITTGQRELFIQTFIPMPPAGLATERVMANVEEARTKFRAIFTSDTTVGIQDTAYGLIQASGEYLDHVRTARTWETRLGRTLMRPEPLKANALKLVREIVKAGV